jgi:hypothetical protein
LLGRKVTAKGGAAIALLSRTMTKTAAEAREVGVPSEDVAIFEQALATTLATTAEITARGAAGDPDGMLGHSVDYLSLFSIVCVAWQWLKMRVVAERAPSESEERASFVDGIRAGSSYWLRTEVPKVAHLAHLCRTAEDSYLKVSAEAL